MKNVRMPTALALLGLICCGLGNPGLRGADPAVSNAPAPRLVIENDIEFATQSDVLLTADIYLPERPEDVDPVPAVLVIHGGGWSAGDKWTMRGCAEMIVERNMIAIAVNYRHAPDHTFPAQLDDLRTAFDWTRKHGGRYGIDTDRIGLFGYSAGGHLAALLAVLADEPVETQRATSGLADDNSLLLEPLRPAAVAVGGAPCEFRDMPPDSTILAYFFGGSRREKPAAYRNASPAAHASKGDVPILFLHGGSDLLVPPESARALYEQHQRLNLDSQWYELEKLGHLFAFLSPRLRTRMADYLAEKLNAPPRE